MRYSAKLMTEICDELKKIPNIKYVCRKFNINRSTFYRWRVRHHTFEQNITEALCIGRESINDSAESVIITGVQDGDVKCATYWLSHNHERYVAVERVPYLEHLNRNDRKFVKEPIPDDSVFDHLAKYLYILEDIRGEDVARKEFIPLVEWVCHEDSKLIDIFYSTYAEYKQRQDNKTDKEYRAKFPDEKP